MDHLVLETSHTPYLVLCSIAFFKQAKPCCLVDVMGLPVSLITCDHLFKCHGGVGKAPSFAFTSSSYMLNAISSRLIELNLATLYTVS